MFLKSTLRSNTAGKGGECSARCCSPAAVTGARHRFATNCSARLGCKGAVREAGAHLQPRDCGVRAGIRGPTLRLSTAQSGRSPSPSPSGAAPGARAHPPRSGSGLTYRLRLPGPAPAAAPQSRAGEQRAPRRQEAAPAPPRPAAARPPALPGGGAGGSASGPSQRLRTRADPGLRALAGRPGRSLPPGSICALSSTSSLPCSLPLSDPLPLLLQEAFPISQSHPTPDLFPLPFHTALFSSPGCKSDW